MNTRILLEERALRKRQHQTWSWVEGESHGRPTKERLHCVEAKLDDVGARSPEGTGEEEGTPEEKQLPRQGRITLE